MNYFTFFWSYPNDFVTLIVNSLRRMVFLVGIGFFSMIIACSKPNNPETKGDNSSQIIDEPDPILVETEIIIDASDLDHLPKDTGGTHTAFPLGTTEAYFGHYVYTPSGYTNDGPEYPLIIFMHGWGERGDSSNDPSELDKVLSWGPPRLIRSNNWDPSYPFVVVSPQLNFTYWPTNKIHEFITYVIDNYQINTNRIYVTGLSLGGGGSWFYAGEMGEESYAAAIVPISASGGAHLIENLAKVPIWAFHGADDPLVNAFDNFGSVPMVNAINQLNPEVKAKLTVYKGTAHNAWTNTYKNLPADANEYDKFDVSIYDWMLQYKRE
ncbi:MAG: hypothetical protein COA50_03655 [Flavobacteriaceae bacterium]|nr:MAG: hypothetical protein COA50_03655 [Flavobacteriaceae bacterium]